MDAPLDRLADHPILTRAQEVALMRRIEAGDMHARDEFIRCNMRLVIKAAAVSARARHVELEELVQVGVLGLLRAIEKYEWRRGWKFSTYATWWITQAIDRALDHLEPGMRASADVRHRRSLVARAERSLTQAGAKVSVTAIARRTGFSTDEVRQVHEWRARRLVSLDHPVGEEGSVTLGEIIADPAGEDAVEVAAADAERAEVAALMLALAPRERQLVIMRFGLDGGRCRNLAEVGRALGLEPIAVRRLERLILHRLRTQAKEQTCPGTP